MIPVTSGGTSERVASDLARAACYDSTGRILLVNARLASASLDEDDAAPCWPVIRHFGAYDTIDVSGLARRHVDEIMRRAPEWLDGLESLGLHNRRIFAFDPLLKEASGLPLVKNLDRALLVVNLNETPIRAAQRTIDLVGRERFLGVLSVSGEL